MSEPFVISMRDSHGGIRFQDMQLQSWVCTDKTIRNLDIWNAPYLESLDLSQLEGGMHLTLVGCPQLRRLRLPAQDGNVIHLDASCTSNAERPLLVIEGAIAHLDCRWPKTSLIIRAPEQRPWQGSYVANSWHLDMQQNPGTREAELLLIQGETSSPQIQLNTDGHRDVYWIAAKGLQQLDLQAANTLEQVVIEQAPELHNLHIASPLVVMRLEDCPQLHHVKAVSQVMKLHRCGAPKLTMDGQINKLFVQSASCQTLIANDTQRAEFELCHHLQHVELPTDCAVDCMGFVPASLRKTARLHVNEATLHQLLADFVSGQPDIRQDLQSLLPMMTGRKQIPVALNILARLLKAGAEPAWVWQLRTELSARHLGQSRQKKKKLQYQDIQPEWLQQAAEHWCWFLPEDLGQDCWKQDWHIWLACHEIPSATKYAEHIALAIADSTFDCRGDSFREEQNGAPPHFRKWLMSWLQDRELQHPHVRSIASQILTRLTERTEKHFRKWGRPRHYSENLNPVLPPALVSHVLDYLYGLGSQSTLQQDFEEYRISDMPMHYLLPHLHQYLQREPERARPLILRLAVKDHSFWGERLTGQQFNALPGQLRMLALTGQLPDISMYQTLREYLQ